MRRWRNRSGLTLAEILVAASIASIVAGGMITMLSLTAGRTSTGNQVAALNEDLKQAQDLISNEAQGASRIYETSELDPAGIPKVSVTGATADYQPIMGFFVPDLTTANENDYYFRLVYLDSPPTDTTGYQYKGPKVLFFSQPYFPGNPGTSLTVITTPLNPGDVLSDYMSAETATNEFDLYKESQKSGLLSLRAMANPACPDPQCVLTLKTRITARN